MSETVLITGTSTGIGEATALHFAREGYAVFAGMRNPDVGVGLSQTAEKEGLQLTVVKHDVCDPDSNQAAVDQAVNASGKIDVLINNAGIGGGGALEETPMESLRSVMETNFFGAIDLTQRVVPGMRERRSGAILNVTSMNGLVALSPMMSYTASKYALEAATEVLAMEMQDFGVRVALIEPGVVMTPIFGKPSGFTPGMSSPYMKFYGALGRVTMRNLESAAKPESLAEVMQEAVETSEPRLRYIVGHDANKMVEDRSRMTDEEWVALGGLPEDGYASRIASMMGNDLRDS
jgi:NAD(P)-dependent dehydrogenase (short-subunit alcohol dehydrogenase family)